MRAQIDAFLAVKQEWRPLALILALVQDVGDDGRPRWTAMQEATPRFQRFQRFHP